MSDDKEAVSDGKPGESDSPHKHLVGVVSVAATFACGTFFLGAIFGDPWPGAVVACGIAVMGLGAAFFMTRRA